MQIRIATLLDIPLINELAQKVWRVYYKDIISEEQIEYMLEKMYSSAALHNQMQIEKHCFVICYEKDIAVGYCSYSEQEAGSYFLHKLYVDTTKHNKGIGSWFFKTVFANVSNLKTLRLTVNRTNYKAINFYFKTGFTIVSVEDFNIGNGYFMNDYVMLLKK